MGVRFRRLVKLAPGFRMNFSGSGPSFSFGPQGASISVGKRGAYFNIGIPGTGLYSRQKIGTNNSLGRASSDTVTMSATISILDDGTLSFKDVDGSDLPGHLIEVVKKQNDEVIQQALQKACEDINGKIEALGEIYSLTPDCSISQSYIPNPFNILPPMKPIPKKHGALGFFIKSIAKKVEENNLHAKAEFENKLIAWYRKKTAHQNSDLSRKKFIEEDIHKSTSAMEAFLKEKLLGIVWPRETRVSFEVSGNGVCVLLDVDLPEIEEMPKQTASVPLRGYRLSVKEMSATQIQKLYMRYVHAVGFRIIGETFAALPKIQMVVLSAYSRRPNSATGQIGDEYLYSVRVHRSNWERIQFDNLEAVEVIEALNQFELRKEMTKTGIFKAIKPFSE